MTELKVSSSRWSVLAIDVTTRRSIAPRRRELVIAMLMLLYGLFLVLHTAWAAMSDRRAAALFHASPGCELRTNDSALVDGPTCRDERVVVESRRWSVTKGDGTAYDLTLRSSDGTHDDMNIRERALLLFWRRVTPGEVIRLQRFVAPGYRLTGSIIALGDKRGWVLTPDHPNSVAPSHVGLVGLGAILFVVGAVLAVNWFRRSRPVSLSR